MNRTKHVALRVELLALSMSPTGFAKSEIRGPDRNTLTVVVNSMANKTPRRLFTAFVSKDHVRYFDKAERAAAYVNRHATKPAPQVNQPRPRPHSGALEAFKKQTAVDPGVKVQRVPGYERMCAAKLVVGDFASAGIGVYPGECSAWAAAASASISKEMAK